MTINPRTVARNTRLYEAIERWWSANRLPHLLTVVPPEQVVEAMGEARYQIAEHLIPGFESALCEAQAERDQAIARAERAEATSARAAEQVAEFAAAADREKSRADRLSALLSAAQEMREVLSRVKQRAGMCPECFADDDEDCEPDCRLARLLKGSKGE